MSSLADLPEIVGFFSYARIDDDNSDKALSLLRERIRSELRLHLGSKLRVWQDTEAIPFGRLWLDEIKKAIAESAFLIPIVTPSAVNSPNCRMEFEAFLARQLELVRDDLVFPVLYIPVPALANEDQRRRDKVLTIIHARQYADWTKIRLDNVASPDVKKQVAHFCEHIVEALRKPWESSEKRHRREEIEARLRAEQEEVKARQRAEEQRRRKEDEERRRVEQEEAKARERAEQEDKREAAAFKAKAERRRKKAEDRTRVEQEKLRKVAEAEAQRRAVEKRDREEEANARWRAEQEDAKEAKALQDKEERRRKEAAERRQRLRVRAVYRVVTVGVVLFGCLAIPSERVSPPTTSVQPERAAAAARVQPASDLIGPLSLERERALKPKDSFKECDNCPEMVVVPAGSFTMGSPEGEKDRDKNEGPQHVVTIGRAFAVGKSHVTFDQFAAFAAEMGHDAGSKCWIIEGGRAEERSGRSWRNPGFAQEGSHPAVCLSWNDAKDYAEWLAKKTQKPYRLLTEAEWEYAARGRTAPAAYPRFWFGNDEKDLCLYGNGADQKARNVIEGSTGLVFAPCNDGYTYTSPAGHFESNAFGLYDMFGNAWQWTADCYNDSYKSASADGSARTTGDCSRRMIRGGSWSNVPRDLRSAQRDAYFAVIRVNVLGFRLARTLTP